MPKATEGADTLRLIGTTIAEKYAIESIVGEGGFAVVYRGTHLLWKRAVAVKVFKALGDVPADHREKLLQDFLREGALLAELSERSAAICQARDVGMLTTFRGDSVPYMVLEWLEGASLDRVLDDEKQRGVSPRTLDEARRLIEPAAQALALAHARGVAHRDVKPANVFVLGDPRSESSTVKLLDFGIAKVVQDAQKAASSFHNTTGNVTSFTPAYGAPEQFSRAHGATGPWTDVFALALVLVELMTHREPLDGDEFMQLAFASSNPSLRPTPRMRGAKTSDGVEVVFARALAVKITERYATCGDFWNALRVAMSLPPIRASVPPGVRDLGNAATSIAPEGPGGAGSSARQSSRSPALPMGAPLGPIASVPPLPPRANEEITNAPTVAVAVENASASTGNDRAGASQVPNGSTAPSSSSAPSSTRRFMSIALGVGTVAILGALVFAVGRSASSPGVEGASPRASSAEADAHTTMASSALPSASGAVVAARPDASACPEGMIPIPGGMFFMGSDDDLDLEKPAHQVTLAPFCIDTFEVTVEAYKSCSDRGACKRAGQVNEWAGITEAERHAYDPLCNARDSAGRAKHPINCVDWEMADQFCRANGARLPTEAEWEFSARGPDGRKYPWGDAPPSAGHLNACGSECIAWAKANKMELVPMYSEDDGWPNTAPVGSFPQGKSRYGVEDVVGNVWEWVSDYYAPYPRTSPDPVVDPKGPTHGTERVIRGGGWNGALPSWVRPTFRFHDSPGKRGHGTGFRCARSL